MTTNCSPQDLNIKITTGQNSLIDSGQTLPPICKDFLNGNCIRKHCKYQHVVTLYKPIEPQPILTHLFIPNKGNVFINLNNLAQQQHYNGLFLCNLGDIIPVNFIEKLLATCNNRTCETMSYFIQQNIRNMITNEIAIQQWHQKIQKVIQWTNNSSQLFDKTNYSTIFIYDISHATQSWIFKSKFVNNNNTWILKYILTCLNMLFTCIYESIEQHVPESINLYISYMKDELSLNNRGSLDFIYGLVTATPGKYISNYFNTNIYYVGALPNLEKQINNHINTGFVYCYLTGTKYISLNDIIAEPSIGKSFEITWHGDMQTGQCINDYSKELNKHNILVYQNLFEKNSQLKTALMDAISSSNIRPKNLLIIGCNLDVEFDKGIISGLKETIGATDFTSLGTKHSAQNVSKHKPTLQDFINYSKNTNGTPKSCNPSSGSCDDETSITTTMSVIMPHIYIPAGDSNGNNSQSHSSTQLNEIMRDLLSGMVTSKLTGNPKSPKVIQNRICTIGINLIKSFDGTISTNQPFDTITGIEKIKEYGEDPTNKIIILCSPRMTHEFFTGFIKQITRTPGYPNRISANFIDFDINPSLRKCLAYHNYRIMRNLYISSFSNDVPITQICKLSKKFNNYLNSIESYESVAAVESVEKLKNNSLGSHEANNDTPECCACCSCLSRNGIGYIKFGNIPYIPLDKLKLITDDSWLPRY